MSKRVKSYTHMAQKLRYNSRARKLAYNTGTRWGIVATKLVMAHKIPDSVLAKELGRSIQAIQAKRSSEYFKSGGIYV